MHEVDETAQKYHAIMLVLGVGFAALSIFMILAGDLAVGLTYLVSGIGFAGYGGYKTVQAVSKDNNTTTDEGDS